jgi:hypothetical protein
MFKPATSSSAVSQRLRRCSANAGTRRLPQHRQGGCKTDPRLAKWSITARRRGRGCPGFDSCAEAQHSGRCVRGAFLRKLRIRAIGAYLRRRLYQSHRRLLAQALHAELAGQTTGHCAGGGCTRMRLNERNIRANGGQTRSKPSMQSKAHSDSLLTATAAAAAAASAASGGACKRRNSTIQTPSEEKPGKEIGRSMRLTTHRRGHPLWWCRRHRRHRLRCR